MDSVDSIVANTRLREWQVPTTVGVSGPIGHGKSTVARMLGEKFGHTEIAFADHLRDVCNTLLGVPFIALTDRTLKNAPLVGSANGHVLPFDLRDPVALNAQIDRTLALAYFTTYEIFANAETAAGVVKVGGGDLEPARVRRGVQMLFLRHIWVPLRNGRIFTPREIMQLVGTEIFRAVDPPIWVWAWTKQAEDYGLTVVSDLRFPNEFAMLRERKAMCIKVTRPGQFVDKGHVSEGLLDSHKFDVAIVNDGTLEDLWQALCETLDIYADLHKADVDTGYAKLITA